MGLGKAAGYVSFGVDSAIAGFQSWKKKVDID